MTTLRYAAMARRICWHGMLQFVLGLLVGLAVPFFTNPRLGLSAHLGGVQNGMFLIGLGLMWDRFTLDPPMARVTAVATVGSLYVIWFALVLAAMLGTSESTPIAGAGFHGTWLAEHGVRLLLTGGALTIIAASVAVLSALGRRRQDTPN